MPRATAMCKILFLGDQPAMPAHQGIGADKGIKRQQGFAPHCFCRFYSNIARQFLSPAKISTALRALFSSSQILQRAKRL